MIRYINCFRKRADLTAEEFRKYWQADEFDELTNKVVELTGAVRYSKSLVLGVETGKNLIADRGLSEPFDGVLEYWWNDARQLQSAYESDEAKQLMAKAIEFQSQFIDLTKSSAFFTENNS